jgi:hypothetical protein
MMHVDMKNESVCEELVTGSAPKVYKAVQALLEAGVA